MGSSFIAPWFDVEALEADDSPVAAIDRGWTIRWVNPAWNRFALANGAPDVPLRYGRGASYLDGIAPPLREFYATAFATTLASKVAFEQVYECSSPDVFRQFLLRALPFDAPGLLVEHSKVVEHPHPEAASPLPPTSYARADGTILQCSNCRRVRRTREDGWDLVPAWTKAPPPDTSHGLCAACSAFYFGVK